MTNTTQERPQTNGQRPNPNSQQTRPAQTTQPPIHDAAPADGAEAHKAAPLNYRAEFLVETAEGFHVLIAGEALTPRDVMVWTKAASKDLAAQGFKPVRRDLVVNMPAPIAAAAGPAAAAGGEATWIKGEGGAPPRCSLHGAGKWVEGDYKPGHAKAGQHFAFWSCSVRDCRPKGNAT